MKAIMKKNTGKISTLYVFLYLLDEMADDIMRHDNCIVSCKSRNDNKEEIEYEDKET